jgi:hypothetical protein
MEKLVPAFPPLGVLPPYHTNTKPQQYGNMNPTKSLHAKRLIINPTTKSPSMVDKELHSHRLKLDTSIADQLSFLVIPF